MPHPSDIVFAECLSISQSDKVWQLLDYPGCPRHGSIAQLFRPSWKVELERRLRGTLFSIALAANVLAGRLSDGQLRGVAEKVGLALGPNAGLLGYSSPEALVSQLPTAVRAYVSSPPQEWSQVFLAQAVPGPLPDNSAVQRLSAGAHRVASYAADLCAYLRLSG